MDSGIIIVNEKQSPTFNAGDYVQSLAAMQFLQKGDTPVFMERDNLINNCKANHVKVIMNGWWMETPVNFPPCDSIIPFYRSFHLRPKIEKLFFTKETIMHLKRHEPIGCRDTNTVKMMLSHGIKAYFSGCLTLTLGLSFKYKGEDSSQIYIVDPFVGKFICKDVLLSINIMLRCLYVSLFKKTLINKIANRIKSTCSYHRQGFDLFLYSTKICAIYSNAFDSTLLESAIYNTHDIPSKVIISQSDRLNYVKQLLYNYSNAKFVITSRIHCGLPCLGIGTPVVFIAVDAISPGRLGGIVDFFRSAYIKKGKCILNRRDFDVNMIGTESCFQNKEKYKKYKDKLIVDCKDFFAKCC